MTTRVVRGLVLCPDFRRQTGSKGRRRRAPESRLSEALGLAQAIDIDVVASQIIKLGRLRPATLFGVGKVEEIRREVATRQVTLVFVDDTLTPVQQRNLERSWSTKVVDRTGLILEIFAARARSKEGRLQVELAHLTYQKSRLVRSWTHLERQRGGLGAVGGPGETQKESDRRLIEQRMSRLHRQLQKVQRTRGLHRHGRERMALPGVALVGYTNAGKSTLFNRLASAQVGVADMLFATLDPTVRAVRLRGGEKIALSDTVGFISDLPTQLIAAFRATLEEVTTAQLIIHVCDSANEDSQEQIRDVEAVLTALGVDIVAAGQVLTAWNKIDLLDSDSQENLLNRVARTDGAVALSAVTGRGVTDLLEEVELRLFGPERGNDVTHR